MPCRASLSASHEPKEPCRLIVARSLNVELRLPQSETLFFSYTSNCMASISMFETALATFVGSLSTAEKERFAFSSVSEVYHEIDKIQKSQESRGSLRNLRRVQSFVDGINRYSQVIEQFVSIKPSLLAFLWVSLGFSYSRPYDSNPNSAHLYLGAREISATGLFLIMLCDLLY